MKYCIISYKYYLNIIWIQENESWLLDLTWFLKYTVHNELNPISTCNIADSMKIYRETDMIKWQMFLIFSSVHARARCILKRARSTMIHRKVSGASNVFLFVKRGPYSAATGNDYRRQ